MPEYIEREVVLDMLMSEPPDVHYASWYMEKVEEIPSADVAPVVHGRFVADEYTYPGTGLENYKCSVCGRINGAWLNDLKPEQFPNYCWNCGAKMDAQDHV